MDPKTFTAHLAKRLDIDTKDAAAFCASFATILRERCASLDSIAIPGFGNFVSLKQAEKIETNQQNAERTLLPPKITVEFVASSALKKLVAHE